MTPGKTNCATLEKLPLEKVISYCCRVPPTIDWQQLPKIFHEVIWKSVHKRRFSRVLEDLEIIFDGVRSNRDNYDDVENDVMLAYDMMEQLRFDEWYGLVGTSVKRWGRDHQRRFITVLHDLNKVGQKINPILCAPFVLRSS